MEQSNRPALPHPPPEGATAADERLGRYRVIGQLGAGGRGDVYLVRDDEFGRELAAKVLRSAGSWQQG